MLVSQCKGQAIYFLVKPGELLSEIFSFLNDDQKRDAIHQMAGMLSKNTSCRHR